MKSEYRISKSEGGSADKQLERSNFLAWIRISTANEICDAFNNHREKMRYLMGKYGGEIGSSEQLTVDS